MAPSWTIGQLVSVQARTWAGINQPGGIARIVKLNDDSSVAVKYVVDGRQETSVDTIYLQRHSFANARGLRNRGMLLGRCGRCGSLRTDCGSCDWHNRRNDSQQESATGGIEKNDMAIIDPDDSSDQSSVDLDRLVDENKRAFQRFKRRQAKSRSLLTSPKNKKNKKSNDGVLADATTLEDESTDESVTELLVGMVATQDVGDSDTDDESSGSIATTFSRNTSPDYPMESANEDILDEDYDTNDAFVQPEGSAERLPDDVTDFTRDIATADLPDFVKNTLLRIEQTMDDTYRPKWQELEQTRASRNEWDLLHTAAIKDLIRNGLDQCRLAMRRARVSEELELQYDTVSDKVEELMASLRRNARLQEEESGSDESSVGSMEGWAENTTSPISRATVARENVVEMSDTPLLDAHPFASRRRIEARVRERRTHRKKRTAKISGSKSSRPSRQRSASPNSGKTPHDSDHSNQSMSIASFGDNMDHRQKDSRALVDVVDGVGEVHCCGSEKEALQKRSQRLRRPRKQRRKKSKSPLSNTRKSQKQKQELAVARMERWIQHNTENIDFGDDADGELPVKLRDELFQDIDSLSEHGSRSIPDESDQLRKTSSSRVKSFHRRRILGEVRPHPKEDVLIVNSLQSVLKELENEGCRTLQDYVSSKSSSLRKFVSLLRAALRYMRESCDLEESPDSTRLKKIFQVNGGSVFLEAVALQLTDTTMSLFNPQAWALESLDSKHLLGQIGQLWIEVAFHTHPIELFARCVMKFQHSQRWRLVREGEHTFVSCVNPDDWKSLIFTGNPMAVPDHSRIKKFENVLPRCEVDAQWGIMAFLSQHRIKKDSEETQSIQYRWDLISILFSKSSLASDERNLPPSVDQLLAALKDLRCLMSLLSRELFGDVPKHDRLLVLLVEKAVSLEAEYFEKETRACWQDAKRVIRVDSFKDMFQHQVRQNRTTPFKEKICDLNGEDVPCFLDQPLLLPSSPLVRVCLGLIICWRSAFRSDKPKRVQKFQKAMSSLIQAISAIRGKSFNDKENRSFPGDSFLDAFGQFGPQAESTTNATLVGLHCLEARAFVSVFSFLPMQPCFDDQEFILPREISSLFSSDQLLDASSLCVDDSSRLEVTAKLSSFLVAALLGENATAGRNSGVSLSVFLFRPLRADADCHDALVSKLVGSLSTCIKKAHEPRIGATVMARVAARVTFALTCLFRHNQDVQQPLVLSMNSLKHLSLCSTTHLFRKIVQLRTAGSDEEACVRTTYSLMRVVASLIGSCSSSLSGDSGQASQLKNRVLEEAGDLTDYISTCIQQSSPSRRFNISNSPEEVDTISAAGMDLISRTMKDAIACIVDIVISTKLALPPILLGWMSERPVTFSVLDSDNDQQYRRRVSCHFAQALTLSIERSSVVELAIGDHKEFFLSCFMQSLLDIKMLAKIPSSNLQQLSSRSGGVVEQIAFSELLDFSRHPNGSLRRNLQAIRTYAKNLSIALKKGDGVHFCTILEIFGQLNPSRDLPHSLELEMIDRFRLICSLLHEASSTATFINLDRLSCQLLGSMSWNVIFLFDKLEIMEKTLAHISGDNYRRSKLIESLTVFLETFVAIFASVSRICGGSELRNESPLSRGLLQLCNSVILPICQGKSIDVKRCLHETIAECSTSSWKDANASESCLPNHLNQLVQQIVLESFVRRSREIFVGLSGSPVLMRSNLFASFIAAANANTVKTICSGFWTTGRLSRSEKSPVLQRSIEEIFREVGLQYPLSESRISNFKNLRQKVIELYILPMLNSNNPQQHLEFLIGVLDSCVDRPCLKSLCLCAVFRAITLVVVRAVREGSSVLLSTIMRCVLSVATLPAVCLRPGATGWLLDWAQNMSDREAEYFWLTFQFHDAFYKNVQNMASDETLSQSVPSLSPALVEGYLDRSIVEKLQKLDRDLFGEHNPVNNVYRKQNLCESKAVAACRSDEFVKLAQKITELLERAQNSCEASAIDQPNTVACATSTDG